MTDVGLLLRPGGRKKAEDCACLVRQCLAETGSGCNALIFIKKGKREDAGSIVSYPGSTEWRKVHEGERLTSFLRRRPGERKDVSSEKGNDSL